MIGPGDSFRPDVLELLDRLAALTRAPDAALPALRALCESDERVRVPPTVFNNTRRQPEPV